MFRMLLRSRCNLAVNGAHAVNNLLHRWKSFLKQDDGVTAIEYSLIAAILGIALLPVLGNTTSGVASLYTRVQGYFDIVNGG